jgi:heme oxygenase
LIWRKEVAGRAGDERASFGDVSAPKSSRSEGRGLARPFALMLWTSIMPGSCPAALRWRLRAATRSHHEAVEAVVAILESTASLDDYRRVLERMWGFYEPLERELARADWRGSGIDIDRRRKSRLIELDLRDLGHDGDLAETLPRCAALPRIAPAPRGFGVLYVIEGATLGGRVILRELGPKFGIGPAFAGRFHASYGSQVGSMWRGFTEALESVGRDRASVAAIEAAAIETFVVMHDWLAAGAADRGG